MFCPKCGNEVPDGAAFCGQCGNKFESVPSAAAGGNATAAKPAGSQAGVASGLKTNGMGIAAAVLAVVALVFSFMPWFDISLQMLGLAGAASGLASGVNTLFGSATGSYAPTMDVEESYAVWNLIGLADAFKSYAQAYSSLGGSRAAGAAVVISIFSWTCLILWVVTLALTIWGAIVAFAKGGMGVLRAACASMAITVIVFFVFAGAMESDTGTANAMPVICLILSVVAFCCSFAAKKRA